MQKSQCNFPMYKLNRSYFTDRKLGHNELSEKFSEIGRNFMPQLAAYLLRKRVELLLSFEVYQRSFV